MLTYCRGFMRIFLVRHGESKQNTHENFDELPDYKVGLTANGEKQAKACGNFLKQYCEDNKIDLKKSTLFVSPFYRTKQTADIINKQLKIDDIKYDVMLSERQYGLFDNMTYEERAKYKLEFDYCNWMYENGSYYFTKFPLGESPFDVTLRARMFLETLFRDEKEGIENFFIISHNTFIKCFQMTYFHYDIDWFDLEQNMNNCDVKLIEKINNKNFDRSYIYKTEFKIK